jgi:hypothetical protein
MLILKQSTSIDIRCGPFVDSTDGVTPETGITLGAADQAEVLKANGAATAAMAGTFAAVTGSDGWYDYTAATGDVDTVGEVVFVIQDSSVCLPVYVRGYVVEEAVYDALYGASAAGPLQSTTAGRKLDVTATGAAGIDWANIENQATTVDLSGTDIQLVDTATTLTNVINSSSVVASVSGAVGSVTGAVGSVTGLTASNLDATISSRMAEASISTTAGSVDSVTTLTTYTGNTLQTADVAARVPNVLNTTATGNIGIDWANVENPTTALDLSGTDIQLCDTVTTNTDAITVANILTTAMTESYAADGVAPTITQAIMLILQALTENTNAGTTQTIKKLDGSTTAATLTLNDGTNPTGVTRAT